MEAGACRGARDSGFSEDCSMSGTWADSFCSLIPGLSLSANAADHSADWKRQKQLTRCEIENSTISDRNHDKALQLSLNDFEVLC